MRMAFLALRIMAWWSASNLVGSWGPVGCKGSEPASWVAGMTAPWASLVMVDSRADPWPMVRWLLNWTTMPVFFRACLAAAYPASLM